MDDIAARDTDLPGAATLLDPVSLAHILGAPVQVRHLRYKPGTSVLTAFTTPAGAFWAGAWAGPDKPESALGRSAEVRPLPGVPWAVFGPARSDRVLARAVIDAQRREPAWADAVIVRHNPGRRLVVRLGGEYAKTAPGRAPAALRRARRLAEAGLPTLLPRLVAADHTWATPSWGIGDLATTISPAHAQAAGRALARMHALPVDGADDADDPGARAGNAARAIASVLPSAARRAVGLARHLPPRRQRAVVHGDFSADQVLLGADGEIRLIDLDRMGAGEPALDLAGFAVEEFLRTGDISITNELVTAYRAAGGPVTDEEWRAWTPLCALTRAIEPFRRCEPGWWSTVAERLERAEDLR
ncbi:MULTISPECIES: phosphotransferase family protein [Microbacterium]|uniref:phosphotransferase family protein n=1 Tax=Microbacterium TaxID=33882 RepID=UPI0027D91892|nr:MULTISPECIES: phosphotransferase [Microbacterium]